MNHDYDKGTNLLSAYETLPILPDPFRYKVLEASKNQFYIVKQLISREDIEYIVNCGDAGREGEYIQRLIYEKAGNQHLVKRLWLNSYTPKEIKYGFEHLLDSREKDSLYEEAKARAQADWIMGINLSRLFSKRYNTQINIGRVLTPTLNLIVTRDKEIENFVPRPYYILGTTFFEGFSGKWANESGISRIENYDDANGIYKKCNGKTGEIISIEQKEKTMQPPTLHSLDSLQKEANQLYGYTAAQVLQIAQKLYDTYKITTYPRTDSNYISEQSADQFLQRIKDVKAVYPSCQDLTLSEPILTRIVNDKKVSDHHAIIVTDAILDFDLHKLSGAEANILHLIIARMLIATAAPFLYDETQLVAVVENETFVSKTKRIKQLGYRDIESKFLSKKLPEDMQQFTVKKGDTVKIKNIEIEKRFTKAPAPYTEGTLIDAMMNIKNIIEDKDLKTAVKQRGLGTVATRAEVIEKLKKVKYIQEEKNGKKMVLKATETGKEIIDVLPDEISSPVLTAEWEQKLEEIEQNNLHLEQFLEEIETMVKKMVDQYSSVDTEHALYGKNNPYIKSRIEIGKCPFCGKPVYENSKSYYCSDYKNCKFSFWKNNRYLESIGLKLTNEVMRNLLTTNQTKASLISKKGKPYNAIIKVKWNHPYPDFSMEFEKRKR